MTEQRNVRDVVSATQEYYDGPADEIYRSIWADNIHLGVPCSDACPHPEAMEHSNELMAQAIALTPQTRVLDVGSGYGSSGRFLASRHGCHVTCSNLSERENELARQRAKEAGLDHLVTVDYGDFHDLQYPDGSFDVVWSQEAFLHGADKRKILSECKRVLVPGGTLVFTDILVKKGTSQADRARIYDRVKSPDMWDFQDYRDALTDLGFRVTEERDWSQYVARSYGWVRDRVKENYQTLSARVDPPTLDKTIDALTFWVDSANAGKIGWGLFVAQSPK